MPLKSVSMIIVFARDYAAMKDWYGKVLGLVFDERRSSDEGQWGVFHLPGGGPDIALHGGLPVKALATGADGAAVASIVPCIMVDDIEATVDELKRDGVVFAKQVRELAGSGVLGADLLDPEGNMIQLLEVKR